VLKNLNKIVLKITPQMIALVETKTKWKKMEKQNSNPWNKLFQIFHIPKKYF